MVEFPEWLKVHDREEVRRASTRMSVLVSGRRGWTSLYVPRLDVHLWFPQTKGEAGAEVRNQQLVQAIEEHAHGWSEDHRLRHRYDVEESLREITLDVVPPTLADFKGQYRHQLLLPPRRPKSEADDSGPARPPTPTLDRLAAPLHEKARDHQLEPAFGRKEIIESLAFALSGRCQAVAVIGRASVGKSAVIDETLRQLTLPAEGSKPKREAWYVDASRLVASPGLMGDWQSQTLEVLEELESIGGIWAIGPLLPLLDAGKHISSDQNVAQLIGPFLLARRCTVVGEVTELAWTQLEKRHPGFARLFTPLRVPEPTALETEDIARQLVEHLETSTGIRVSREGRAVAARLARRYGPADVSLFGQRMAFLRRLVGHAEALDTKRVEADTVIEVFAGETGLPVALLRDDQPLDTEALIERFQRRLIGQPQVIERLVDLVAVIKSGLSDLQRPLGSFLFVGPTGVGKTEAAKALAEYLFGNAQRLLRFDMSELSTPEAMERFIGGAGDGRLVAGIRRQPFSVVLLDEIEKAHPTIFDVLLQVLGEGRLTDETGRTADFRNAAIIMTSNLGVGSVGRSLGFTPETGARAMDHFRAEAERFFRPEFFNRIDHILAFEPLGAEAIRSIADRELARFARRDGLKERHLEVHVPAPVREALAKAGVDERYGARPLKRVIEQRLATPLARFLARTHAPVGSTISAALDSPTPPAIGLCFEVKPPPAGKANSAGRAPLARLVDDLGDIRFRLQRWMASRDFREVGADVRLLEQLGRVRAFWDDRQAAEARMRGLEEKRTLVHTWFTFRRNLNALEDLVLEAFYDRDISSLEELQAERDLARGKVEQLELDLYDRRFTYPSRLWLRVVGLGGQNRLFFRLLETYFELALEHRWRVDVLHPVETLHPDGERRRLWTTMGSINFSESEEINHEKARRVARSHAREEGASDILLYIQGERAAPLLRGEAGTYQMVTSSGPDHAVHVHAYESLPGSPEKLRHRTFRTVHDRRHLMIDHLLRTHYPLKPRWSSLIERLARDRMFSEVFGTHREPWMRWRLES